MSAEAARQAFEKLYGHLLLSGKDAAWNVFLSGWEAREEQPAPAQLPPNCGTGYCSCIECLFEKSGIGITKGGA